MISRELKDSKKKNVKLNVWLEDNGRVNYAMDHDNHKEPECVVVQELAPLRVLHREHSEQVNLEKEKTIKTPEFKESVLSNDSNAESEVSN